MLAFDHWSTTDDLRPGATAQVELPTDAKQGPTIWYTGLLKYRIVAPSSPDAPSFVFSASMNGFAFAQIRAQRVEGGGDFRWTTADLLNGSRQLAPVAHEVDGAFENYLQLNSVRPGSNEVSFSVRPTGPGDLSDAAHVEILPGSTILRTDDHPDVYAVSTVSLHWRSSRSLQVRLAVDDTSSGPIAPAFDIKVVKTDGATIVGQHLGRQVGRKRVVDLDLRADRRTASKLAVHVHVASRAHRSRTVTSNLVLAAEPEASDSRDRSRLGLLTGSLILVAVGAALLRRRAR